MNGRRRPSRSSQRDAALDRDFVLSVECDGLDAPQAWIERDDDGARRSPWHSRPISGTTTTPCEVMFLVDRSGSMEGTSIDEVRNALQLCLRSMIPGCRSTSSASASTFAVAVPRESRLRRGQPGRGERARRRDATPISAGPRSCRRCSSCSSSRGSAGRPRQVVVLTDGEVTQHRRGDRAGAAARRARAHLHVRHRRRREPAPGQGARARRRRVRGVHLPGRAHRAEGDAPVRTPAVAGAHRRPRLVGRARREAGARQRSRRSSPEDAWSSTGS